LKASHKKLGEELTSAEIDHFLGKLSKTKQEWQVDQAALSIKIYQYFNKTRHTQSHFATIDGKQQWQYVAKEMKNILRLKQRALSTERTYLFLAPAFLPVCKWPVAVQTGQQSCQKLSDPSGGRS
jgi:hypothetical protein